jgi:hypothetical protein
MAVDMSSTHPASRFLQSSATIQYNDGGPGGAITFDALGTLALPGNPTALVGLAAINGVALTWMRSDAAPALDQGITPTWTGLHVFTNGSSLNNPSIRLASNRPIIAFIENDGAANNRTWFLSIQSEQLRLAVANDSGSSSADIMVVDRTLNVIDQINLLATTVSVNGQDVRDAAILTSGTVATARLGSGTADATTWLRGDQSWQVLPGGFTGFANPTASIGLAAVNGVATTAMRSDAAPALDQGIAPTWTGIHAFTAGSSPNNPSIRLASNRPLITLIENDGAADNRMWFFDVQAEQLRLAAANDAGSTSTSFLVVDRTLNVIDQINLLATTVSVNGQDVRDAAILTSGTVATARLGSGTADATTWLRGDQSWQALPGSFTGFANPTASIGLAAINGVATTAMRSDAAPALDQAVAPTWTGEHIFAVASPNYGITVSSTEPLFRLNETDAAADNQKWRFRAQGEQFQFQTVNDANTVSADILQVDRTGTTVDSIVLSAPLVALNGIHNGTAPTGAANQYIASGTYTPTLNLVINLSSATPNVCQWMRVGNVVTVSGSFSADPVSASVTSLGMTLPVASNLSAASQLGGVGVGDFGGTPVPIDISGDTTNDVAFLIWLPTAAGNDTASFTFTYLVL